MYDSTLPRGMKPDEADLLTLRSVEIISGGGELRRRALEIVEYLAQIARVEQAALIVVDGDGLVVLNAVGPGHETVVGSAVYRDEGLIGECVGTTRTVISDHPGPLDTWAGCAMPWMLVSPLAEPLGGVFGCVQLGSSQPLGEREAYLAEIAAYSITMHFRTHGFPRLDSAELQGG